MYSSPPFCSARWTKHSSAGSGSRSGRCDRLFGLLAMHANCRVHSWRCSQQTIEVPERGTYGTATAAADMTSQCSGRVGAREREPVPERGAEASSMQRPTSGAPEALIIESVSGSIRCEGMWVRRRNEGVETDGVEGLERVAKDDAGRLSAIRRSRLAGKSRGSKRAITEAKERRGLGA